MASSHLMLWLMFAVLRSQGGLAEVCSFREYGDVRLRGGTNNSQGRVEVCLDEVWGEVCDSTNWIHPEAVVVCKQLGFSPFGTRSCNRVPEKCNIEPDTNRNATIHYGSIICGGRESKLIDCMNTRYSGNCSGEIAAVKCGEGRPPQEIQIQANSSIITVSWMSPVTGNEVLIRYDVTCSTEVHNDLQLSLLVTSVSNETYEATLNHFYLSSNLTCCVTSVFEAYSSEKCVSLYNATLMHPQQKTDQTVLIQMSNCTNQTVILWDSNQDIIGGVLGFIIIVLAIVSVLACLALAYSRCTRPKSKETGGLSSVRGSLDRTMHNPAYDASDGPQQLNQIPGNMDISSNNPQQNPNMQSNSLGHEYDTIDSRITAKSRHRNQFRQMNNRSLLSSAAVTHIETSGSHDQHEATTISNTLAQSYQYEVIDSTIKSVHTHKAELGEGDASLGIPKPAQSRNHCSDIDPTMYEVSEVYLNRESNTNPEGIDNGTVRGEKKTGTELDTDGYAPLKASTKNPETVYTQVTEGSKILRPELVTEGYSHLEHGGPSLDIDPTMYEVSDAYLSTSRNTNPGTTNNETVQGQMKTSPELDIDGYAFLDH